MTQLFAVLGLILLVADLVTLYWMRKQVNDRIRTPFERIPALMFTPSYFRMLRLHRQSYPSSWLWHAHHLTEIGFALCILGVVKSLK